MFISLRIRVRVFVWKLILDEDHRECLAKYRPFAVTRHTYCTSRSRFPRRSGLCTPRPQVIDYAFQVKLLRRNSARCARNSHRVEAANAANPSLKWAISPKRETRRRTIETGERKSRWTVEFSSPGANPKVFSLLNQKVLDHDERSASIEQQENIERRSGFLLVDVHRPAWWQSPT